MLLMVAAGSLCDPLCGALCGRLVQGLCSTTLKICNPLETSFVHARASPTVLPFWTLQILDVAGKAVSIIYGA